VALTSLIACSAAPVQGDLPSESGTADGCSAGTFVEGGEVKTCFSTGILALPLNKDAKQLLEGSLEQLGLDRAKLAAEYYILPRSVAPDPNARALFKPQKGRSERLPLVELNEAFDTAADDGALLLALLHEYGHVAQYLRGEPAGDEINARFCTNVTADECESRVIAHLQRMERDADAFMVATIKAWTPAQVAAVDFDPWALVDLIEASPVGPAYPPTAERIAPIANALESVGLPRGKSRKSRVRLSRLAAFGAASQAAIDAQGGVPN
jgi:hypothetical protein